MRSLTPSGRMIEFVELPSWPVCYNNNLISTLELPHRGVCGSFSGPHLNLYKCIPPFIISGYFHQEQKTRPSFKRPHAFWPHNGEQGTWAHADEAAAEKAECLCIVSYNCDLRDGLTAHSGKDTCARRRLVLKKHFLMWWINLII